MWFYTFSTLPCLLSRAARQSVWINGDSYLQPVRLERQPGTRERMVQGADRETYHKPTDQTHPETDDYSGLLQEVHLFFDLGYRLAQETGYPEWKSGSEFADILER